MKHAVLIALSISLLTFFKACPKDGNNTNRGNSNTAASNTVGATNSNSADAPCDKKCAELMIGQLRGVKSKVEGYRDLLKDKYKNHEGDQDFVDARKLYVDAKAAYDEYLGTFFEAVREGNQRDLINDSTFKEKGQQAANLSSRFVDKATTLTSRTLGTPGIGDIVDAAIKVWKAWKDDGRKKRNDKADRLEKQLTWDKWTPGPAATPTATPATGGSGL
jgi:hypothetical protein